MPMTSSTVVREARRALGPVGVFLPVPTTSAPPVDLQRDAVRRLERAGYRAAWTNETVGGKDALVQLAVLMAATERMVFGTGIANIWARSPQTAHGASALLAQAYPGRFVLGLGVGYPQQAASVGREFGSPVATMRDYLDRMGAPTQLPAPDVAYPRIIGANGPKMLALAGEITDGALPAMQPPDFTAQARQVLGPDKLLVVFMHATTEQGGASAIMATVREHLAAGADHVLLGQPIGTDFAVGVDHLEQLAPALAELP
jgi:probable F420-dependent oxidoreductase